MTERYAIYYAPALSDPLWRRAIAWIGRDGGGGTDIAGLEASRRHDLSVSARRYGFHATLKPPMALAGGSTAGQLTEAVRDFCARHYAVEIGRLRLSLLDGFLALMPAEQSEQLTDFAAACVIEFDRFRAPLTSADRDIRLRAGLSPRHIELLDTYGYPYVLENFRFHMTLTDRLPEDDRGRVIAAAEDWFAPVLERTYVLDRIVLFHEAASGAPFERGDEAALRSRAAADA